MLLQPRGSLSVSSFKRNSLKDLVQDPLKDLVQDPLKEFHLKEETDKLPRG